MASIRDTPGGGWKLAGACKRSAIVERDLGPRPLLKVGRDRLRPGKIAGHEAGKPRRHPRDVPPDLRRRPPAALRHTPRRIIVRAAQARTKRSFASANASRR